MSIYKIYILIWEIDISFLLFRIVGTNVWQIFDLLDLLLARLHYNWWQNREEAEIITKYSESEQLKLIIISYIINSFPKTLLSAVSTPVPRTDYPIPASLSVSPSLSSNFAKMYFADPESASQGPGWSDCCSRWGEEWKWSSHELEPHQVAELGKVTNIEQYRFEK